MALYQERGTYNLFQDREACLRMLGDPSDIKRQIHSLEREMDDLGLCWFGWKRREKRRLQQKINDLEHRLYLIELGRNPGLFKL